MVCGKQSEFDLPHEIEHHLDTRESPQICLEDASHHDIQLDRT